VVADYLTSENDIVTRMGKKGTAGGQEKGRGEAGARLKQVGDSSWGKGGRRRPQSEENTLGET